MNILVWSVIVVLFCSLVGFRDWRRQKDQKRYAAKIDADLSEVETRLRKISNVREMIGRLPENHKNHSVG
jgi:hypothetical protein